MIPYHLADLKTFPQSVLGHFEAGCFSVSITGNNYYCVALDEAYEMEINLKTKQAINSFSSASLASLTHYLPYRAETLHNFKNQLCIEKTDSQHRETNKPYIETEELTIRQYISELATTSLFKDNSESQLVYIFKKNVATKDQSDSMLNYRQYGITDMQNTQEPVRDLDQFMSLPRAISDASGLPVKGTKSNALKVLKSTYKDAFLTSLQVTDDAVQSTVILEGMFLINTIPLSSHMTFIDYAEFLFTRWIVKSHIQFKAQEIHVVFDHPNRNGESPKDIERSRRTHEFIQENITYNTVSSDLLLPTNWRNFLNVRDHKRKFVNYLSSQLINFALQRFQDHECTVVTAGGYEDLYVDKALGAGDGDISEFSDFNSNHEEGDTRVWLHAIHSKSQRIIIYSPDTDTFFVGLPFIDCLGDKTIYLQLKDSTFDHQFVDMHRFSLQMSNAMCLKELGNSENCIQMVYIASGYDQDSDLKDSEPEENISYDSDSENDNKEIAMNTSGNTSTNYINYWDTFENDIFALPTD
ncbi:unnamed protein product [Mytilus coruscus]|uniref:Uncharacterized protein n=1 Tax=Mytilus coruscus TaxID=42192 RepID=A0A6J8DFI8_MYTCO|nr:unnamed protein product [Mytilus coruscus]